MAAQFNCGSKHKIQTMNKNQRDDLHEHQHDPHGKVFTGISLCLFL